MKPVLLKDIIESLLFFSEEPLAVKDVAAITEHDFKDVEEALQDLVRLYAIKEGLQIIRVAGGYQMATRPQVAKYIEKMDKGGHSLRLSQAAMESLAIIAFKQPVTRVEVEAIRGVRVDKVLENLVKKKLIRITGRKNVPGRPMTYGTTKVFLKYFGLNSLNELPPLDHFKEMQKSL